MNWRELRKTDEILAHVDEIYDREQRFPRWFRDASKIWTSDKESILDFITDCQEVFGLFDGEKLIACVYVEQQRIPSEMMIHLSLLHRISPATFVAQAAKLRDMLFHRGVRKVRGWVLQRNYVLCKLLDRVGFLDTELRIDQGVSHGRILRWALMEVRC